MRARRVWAWPLVPVYWLGLWVKDQLRGEPRRLGWPVVSVGSLSAGGAGKTPVVIALALMLKERGWGVDVLSRGYGRSGDGVERVAASLEQQIPFGDDNQRGRIDGAPAVRLGDEPLLIARRAEVEVWVGADRFAAGVLAEGRSTGTQRAQSSSAKDAKEDSRRVHLLDDGFQHRGLGRTVDVVLVTAEDLGDALLPAGNRREGLRALRRADVVVVREEEAEAVEGRLKQILGQRWPGAGGNASGSKASGLMEASVTGRIGPEATPGNRRKVRVPGELEATFTGVHRPVGRVPGPLETKMALPEPVVATVLIWTVRRTLRFAAPLFVFGAGLRPVAFCAIARPEGFAEMLLKAGCGVVDTIFFADHHAYDMEDIERIVELGKELKASGFVTTEKDAVKLTAAMIARLETLGPVMVAALDAEFVFPERVARELESRLTRELEARLMPERDEQNRMGRDSRRL